MKTFFFAALALLAFEPTLALAQTSLLEALGSSPSSLQIGPAAEYSSSHKATLAGASASVTFAPFDDALKIEIGAASLANSSLDKIEAEVLFKKPFRLSSSSELDIGIGPELERIFHASPSHPLAANNGYPNSEDSGSSVGVAFSMELISVHSSTLSWYVGPQFSQNLSRNRNENSIGASAGIHFSW